MQDVDKLREKYLSMPAYSVELMDEGLFNQEELKELAKYGNWFEAICSGKIPLKTEKLKHFNKAQETGYEPKSRLERLWYRYQQAKIPF